MDAISLSQGLGTGAWELGKSPLVPIALAARVQPTINSPPSTASRSESPAASKDTPQLREAFNDFVGQTFFGELLKQMRATVDKPAYFHGGLGEEVFQSQMDQVLVEQMSQAAAPTFSEPMYELLMARR